MTPALLLTFAAVGAGSPLPLIDDLSVTASISASYSSSVAGSTSQSWDNRTCFYDVTLPDVAMSQSSECDDGVATAKLSGLSSTSITSPTESVFLFVLNHTHVSEVGTTCPASSSNTPDLQTDGSVSLTPVHDVRVDFSLSQSFYSSYVSSGSWQASSQLKNVVSCTGALGGGTFKSILLPAGAPNSLAGSSQADHVFIVPAGSTFTMSWSGICKSKQTAHDGSVASESGLAITVQMEFVEMTIGDTNGDGSVNSTDLNQLLAGFGRTEGEPFTDGDVDGDGDVDAADLDLLLAAFGT